MKRQLLSVILVLGFGVHAHRLVGFPLPSSQSDCPRIDVEAPKCRSSVTSTIASSCSRHQVQKRVEMIRETALVRWIVGVNRSAARIGFLPTTTEPIEAIITYVYTIGTWGNVWNTPVNLPQGKKPSEIVDQSVTCDVIPSPLTERSHHGY